MFRRTNPSIKSTIAISILFSSILLSGGCATTSEVDNIDQKLSIVFGYFDMSDAPSWGGIDWVSLKQYKPKESNYILRVKDGVFWHLGVSNGTFRVSKFGRNSRWYSGSPYTYGFGEHGRNGTHVVIQKPGIYYLGSYEYIPIKADSPLQPDSFNMTQVDSPSEKKVLAFIIKQLQQEARDSTLHSLQIEMLKKKLEQLD